MKRCILTGLILLAVISLLALSMEESDVRVLNNKANHTANNVRLRVSNYGIIGSCSDRPQWPSLEYPPFSGSNYLYVGAIWIGAKQIRRDENGNVYYWANWPPANENDTVTQESPGYDPDIHARMVIDTLTSVGFDGDADFTEILPAYFPFESDYLGEQYAEYSPFDVVVRSILGYPSLNDESFPDDPLNYYDFFLPQPVQGDFPGIETLTSFTYDHSPFTPWGELRHRERKEGSSASRFMRYPLYLSIRQRSLAWAYEALYDMIFFSYDIYNSSEVDTMYDLAIGFYMDNDIGHQDLPGDQMSLNDVSGYYAGEGYEFAYSRDYDNSEGTNPHWVAWKFFTSNDQNIACYTWTRGDGPDDTRPRNIPPLAGQITSNEKYWLMTGRNAEEEKFIPMRPENWVPGMEQHYEQEEPNDTRYLYSIYGDMLGMEDPSPTSLNLAPGESITVHSVLFFGDDLEDLKTKSLLVQEFYESGYDLSPYNDTPFTPFIFSAVGAVNALVLNWVKEEGADAQYIYYRETTEPESEWEIIELDVSLDNHTLGELIINQTYDLKIAVLYDGLVLESVVWKVKITPVSVEDASSQVPETGNRLIGNYPNPFNPDTQIAFYLDKPAEVKMRIYNVKGQLVAILAEQHYDSGYHTLIWDGKNNMGHPVTSGVYFYRLITPDYQETQKMLLLK